MTKDRQYHIGIIGSGFIAKGLIMALKLYPQLVVSGVVTRRPIDTLGDFPLAKKYLTHSVDELIRVSDLIVECSGDAIHGTKMVEEILKAGLPVVTMNPELHITSGTQLIKMGTLIEAEGDQPGTLAALDSEVKRMGFKPIVYGNIKGFLNLKPTREDMVYWSKKQGISLPQVTAFTDGSKVQVEQALVANGLGATITGPGLSGIKCSSYEDGAQQLGQISDQAGQPISDYVLCAGAPAGVFIVAKHDQHQAPYLKYLKLGDGPNYSIIKPYHLCHLEIAKTILKVLKGDESYSFNNGPTPTVQVVAVAKTALPSGTTIERGLGSFELRGEAVKIAAVPHGVPITLMHQARLINDIAEGQMVTFADVQLPQTRALQLWLQTVAEVMGVAVPLTNGVTPPPFPQQAPEADQSAFQPFSLKPAFHFSLGNLLGKSRNKSV